MVVSIDGGPINGGTPSSLTIAGCSISWRFSIYKWMITGGTPISGNPQINGVEGNFQFLVSKRSMMRILPNMF